MSEGAIIDRGRTVTRPGIGLVAAGALAVQALAAAPSPRFHHLLIRVGTQNPAAMRDYYYSLFAPDGVRKDTVGTAEDVASGDAHMLFAAGPLSPSRPYAVWHFGWGSLVLGEAYSQHYLNEIEWKDPRVSLTDRFHLHLNSVDPPAAARWYASAFGAEVTLAAEDGQAAGADDVSRRAEAFVNVGGVLLAFYRTSEPLACSTGQRVDHLGVTADTAMVVKATRVSHLCGSIEPLREFGAAAVVEGPDGLIIEVVPP